MSIDRRSACNSCNSKPKHARSSWSAQRAYNGQLLQLLCALPSGSTVSFTLVIKHNDMEEDNIYTSKDQDDTATCRCNSRQNKLSTLALASKTKVKGKGQVLDIALLHDEHMLRSALQPRNWQLIGMS